MSLHRFFLDPTCFTGEEVVFPDDYARQITRVLRLGEGDHVVVLDGSGWEWTGELRREWGSVLARLKDRRRNRAEPQTRLTLYQGLLRGPRMEIAVQKCTEVGVSSIVPVVTERCVATDMSGPKRHRFQTIAREAAEQSGRGRVPEIAEAESFAEAVSEMAVGGAAIMLWEEETDLLGSILSASAGPVSLLIGPEGGLTLQEAELARQAGVHTASLGPRILRAETAAIVGTALVLQTCEPRSPGS